MGIYTAKYFFKKSHENRKYRADFVLIARVEIFQIDPFIAEQLGVKVCKFQTPIKIFLCHSVQRSQMIYVVQYVHFNAK